MIKKITLGTGMGCLMIAAIAAELMGNRNLFLILLSICSICELVACMDEQTGRSKLIKLEMSSMLFRQALVLLMILNII